MNTQQLFRNARNILHENRDKLYVLEVKLQNQENRKKELERIIQSTSNKIKDINDINKRIEVFSKEVRWELNLIYKLCTNQDAVNSDPYGRSSDYSFEDRKESITIEKATLFFSENKKPFFYQPENFFIQLHSSGEKFNTLVLNIKLSVERTFEYYTSNVSITNTEVIETDPDFFALLKQTRKVRKNAIIA